MQRVAFTITLSFVKASLDNLITYFTSALIHVSHCTTLTQSSYIQICPALICYMQRTGKYVVLCPVMFRSGR